MIRTVCTLALGLGIAIATLSIADAACQISRFRFTHGKTVPVSVVLEKGGGCHFHLTADSGILDGVKLIVRPHHGRFGKESGDAGSYAYIPTPGFTGQDAFAIYVLYYSDTTKRPAWSELRYRLTVTDKITTLANSVQAESCRDMVCHKNPTCQQLRNAGKCEAARAALSNSGGQSR
jgi:hypothetical protein